MDFLENIRGFTRVEAAGAIAVISLIVALSTPSIRNKIVAAHAEQFWKVAELMNSSNLAPFQNQLADHRVRSLRGWHGQGYLHAAAILGKDDAAKWLIDQGL